MQRGITCRSASTPARNGPEVDDHEEEATRRAYQEAVELYNYAEAVFELFLPLTCEGPTTRKFWGAVKTLTTVRDPADLKLLRGKNR